MKILIIIIFFSSVVFAREKGQTEITTDAGIEVFQKEKYYLLKENVKIMSDDYSLEADIVRAYFEKDLYDIVRIKSEGNVKFLFTNGAKGNGEKLDFSPLDKTLIISGKNSYLIYDNLEMQSDEIIDIDNNKGIFKIIGKKALLNTTDLNIKGESIEGSYEMVNNIREITNLKVTDEKIANIINNKYNMFAKMAIYSKKENIIELFDDVEIIRDTEVVTGDYAKINTLNQSYKISSKESNKVKLIIESSDEQN